MARSAHKNLRRPGQDQLSDLTIRPAKHDDLPDLFRLTLDGLGDDVLADRVTSSDHHPFHIHALNTGLIVVADTNLGVVGYATAIERRNTRVISQLFVDRNLRGAGIGAALFDTVDSTPIESRGLLATDDPRAVSLYIRHGYKPAWPVYTLDVSLESAREHSGPGLNINDCNDIDRLVELDVDASGRERREDIAYWISTGASPVVIWREEVAVGYAFVHDPLDGPLASWHDDDAPVIVGPAGCSETVNVTCAVSSLLERLGRTYRGRKLRLEIPGKHRALPSLFEAGARIVDIETAMFDQTPGFGDPTGYIPSGGLLL